MTWAHRAACTGFRFDASIFADACRPELTLSNRFPAQTSAWESINVPDLYFAGTLMQVRDYHKSTGGFIHGFRYGVRALHRILEQRYHASTWPHCPLPKEPDALMQAVIARVNRTSALWQQFAFLCDLLVVGDASAQYYEELPVEGPRRVTLLVVPGDGWNEQCFAQLRDDMSRLLGPEMETNVDAVTEIQPEKSGKRPLVKAREMAQ